MAILVSDVVGYSRLAGADGDRTTGATARASQRSAVDPTISDASPAASSNVPGDGNLVEFPQRGRQQSRCAHMSSRTASSSAMPDCRPSVVSSAVSVSVSGDVVEEAGGDLMGDTASTSPPGLASIAKPGASCLSEQAELASQGWKARSRWSDRGPTQLKNITEPNPGLLASIVSVSPPSRNQRRPRCPKTSAAAYTPSLKLSFCRSPISSGQSPGFEHFVERAHGEPHDRPLTDPRALPDAPAIRRSLQGQAIRRESDQEARGRAFAMSPEGSVQRGANRVRALMCSSSTPETGSHLSGPSASI